MILLNSLIGLAALVAAILFIAGRRERARREPLPQSSPLDAGDLLEDRLPWLARLDIEQRARFGEQVQRFLRHKRFIGCAGMEITDEMRLLVAGMASLLVLRPGAAAFPKLKEVLIYPGPFRVPVTEPDELGLVPDEPEERIGESWQGDRVVLSWQDVEAALDGDAVNVVVHEFAHQLDDENGAGDGAPSLADYTEWAQVMQSEFDRLRRLRRPRVLDPYGAESPAEFFGVASEAFFQRGADLAHHHRRLYELLRDYYGFETA